MKQKKKGRKRKTHKFLLATAVLTGAALLCAAAFTVFHFYESSDEQEDPSGNPSKLLLTYMDHLSKKEYEQMYAMLDTDALGNLAEEDFITRNSSIYEGIEMQNMDIKITGYDEEQETVRYETSFDTAAGNISFENEASFLKEEDGYGLIWEDSLIFPDLRASDKVRVSVIRAKRGEILDRNGIVLAGWGTAASVGIVPGKLKDKKQSAARIAELLETDAETVMKKLEAGWVKEDSFVPVKTLPAVRETDLMKDDPDEQVLKEKMRQEQLLAIPGVMISEIKVREYPLKQAASHLTGYIQNVTAEDLKEHAGEGYTADSVIGRSGIEALFEKELKGHNGCRIYITDSEGKERKELARTDVKHGQNVTLTIDARLQTQLYEQFQEDKSCSVAMDPYTGEVLALVSTPSYDSNDFIMGMSSEMWSALNEDEKKPLYNRFRQKWCPGSSFKPVIAAIGMETGTLNPEEDLGCEGTSWQNSASWGGYYVTTLHAASPAVMDNALVYSDNIYFAKAALKIGAEKLEQSLQKLGFGKEPPFEIRMAQSQYSNTENIETEIQLADSGYGQGQILLSPLHLACIYTAFCNDGNMLKPYLERRPDQQAEIWIQEAFPVDVAERVLDGMKQVISDPEGTGHALFREDAVLAGKTGTAEIKASKEDSTGTELGWMAVFTAERNAEHPVLIVSMTEDVKGRGGSGYVVNKEKEILDGWFEGR